MMRRRTSPRLGRVVAIARRDLAIELSYQLRLIIRYLSVGALAVLVFYASDLVQDPEELEGFAGGYYEFVIVGLAVTAFADLGLSSFTRRMSEEQAQGTLEALLATPTRPGTLLTGGFLVPLLLTAVEVALLVGFGIGVAGVGIPVGGLLISLPLFILTIISFCTLGIISAALIIVAKRGDPLTGPAYQLTLLLSGAVFPIEVF
ncbi:MAG: ABC transporter permease, partial [Acidimicrobiia bacterium]|nr:ABC transporter permease [Acidimicrobiia bacterium]